MDYVDSIFQYLNTFTDLTRENALNKCAEIKIDPNRGEVPLSESLINLMDTKSVLIDAIEKKKIIQLPITIQKEIYANVSLIAKQLGELFSGIDQVDNLTKSIEQLNVIIWQYGFHNLSDQVLGYLEKMNQLKNQQVKITGIISEAEKGIGIKNDLNNLLSDLTSKNDEATDVFKNIGLTKNQADEQLKSVTDISQKSNAIMETIRQNDLTVQQMLSSSMKSKTEVDAIEARAKEFAKEIDNYRNDLSEISKNASSMIMNNNIETQETIKKMNAFYEEIKIKYGDLVKQIDGLLPSATSAGLASAFESRRVAYKKQKNWWTLLRMVSIAGFLIYGLIIFKDFAQTIHDTDGKQIIDLTKTWLFYFANKSPILVGLLLLEEFSRRTFNKLFKLEEDYAHKQVLSQSFEGYKNQLKELGADSTNSQILITLCENTIEAISKNPIRLMEGEKEKGIQGIIEDHLPINVERLKQVFQQKGDGKKV